MSYPKTPVIRPSALLGKLNGQLPDSVLTTVDGGARPDVTLVDVAARAWRAMVHAAQADGIELYITSAADSYRTLNQQITLFRSRYLVVSYSTGIFWDGHFWVKADGMATAAIPGTSSHGWGLAEDVANATGTRLQWLLSHAAEYGFSWELDSEPWHIRYHAGDTIPRAVLTFEEGNNVDQAQIKQLAAVNARVGALVTGATEVVTDWSTRNPAGLEPIVPNVRLAAVESRLLEISDRLGELASKVDAMTAGTSQHSHDVGPAVPVS